MQFNPNEPLRVENYGTVSPHQVWAFNYHLQNNLNAFDKEYQKKYNAIGSSHHHYHRQEFARAVSENLISNISKDEILEIISGDWVHSFSDGTEFHIETKSTLGYSISPTPNIPTPFFSPNDETLRIELFGNIAPHQSASMNYHLQTFLKEFDNQYKKEGGVLGSEAHRYERFKFSEFVSIEMIKDAANKDFQITSWEGVTEYNCETMPVTITVEGQSTLGKDNRLITELPYYEPN